MNRPIVTDKDRIARVLGPLLDVVDHYATCEKWDGGEMARRVKSMIKKEIDNVRRGCNRIRAIKRKDLDENKNHRDVAILF